MIYSSYDYLSKYYDTLGEIIALARLDKYSNDFIEKTIASSKMISELENSNITLIAFSSSSLLYRSIFPEGKSLIDDIAMFDMNYWMGEMYMSVFLKYKLTFEAIFTIIPLEVMQYQYVLYHEMDISSFFEYFESLLKEENLFSRFLKKKKVSAVKLSKMTGISLSTIRSIKENKRDIKKMRVGLIENIAIHLDINIRSLLCPITLEIQ